MFPIDTKSQSIQIITFFHRLSLFKLSFVNVLKYELHNPYPVKNYADNLIFNLIQFLILDLPFLKGKA